LSSENGLEAGSLIRTEKYTADEDRSDCKKNSPFDLNCVRC